MVISLLHTLSHVIDLIHSILLLELRQQVKIAVVLSPKHVSKLVILRTLLSYISDKETSFKRSFLNKQLQNEKKIGIAKYFKRGVL